MKKKFTRLSSVLSVVLACCFIGSASLLSAQTFSNNSAITIPNSGESTPYPSTINVSGGPASIESMSVTLYGFNHTFPSDVDVLLVGPGGQSLVLMSDCGGSFDVTGINMVIADFGTATFPTTVLSAGSYLPTDRTAGDTWGTFAGTATSAQPVGAATFQSQFSTLAADGDWSLYVIDDAGGDLGGFDGGWDITFSVATPGCTDLTACNYDSNANQNDGSCVYPGCTDGSACNYDATAGCDDGSCCYGSCVTVDMFDSFGDGWNGNVLTVAELGTGTVVATASLTAGGVGSAQICLNPGCYTVTVGGGSFQGEVTWTLTGVDGGSISGDGFATDIVIGAGGSNCVPGCTDLFATNYNPSATIDDGSCQYCAPGESLLSFNMFDTFGDGWNGGQYFILDASGNIVSQGSLDTAQNGDGNNQGNNLLCLASGCYTVSIAGSSFPAEIEWNITDPTGTIILSALAPNGAVSNAGFAWGGATGCVIQGCTNPVCNNFNPSASVDDGSCLCPPANDACADAIAVTCGMSVTGTLQYANADADAIDCGTVTVNTGGVWYELIGDGSQVTASLCTTGWDTEIHVYSGSCGALSCVASNDDATGCTGGASEVLFSTTTGVAYRIFVSKFSTFNTNNDFTLDITCTDCSNSTPVNDDCANAIPAPCGITIPGSLCCANPDDISAVSAFTTGYGVWYVLNSENYDTFDFTLTNGDVAGADPADGTQVGAVIYVDDQGAGCGGLTFVAACPQVPDQCAGSLYSIGVNIVPNANYYFLVYTSVPTGCGSFTFQTNCSYVGCTDPSADNYDPAAGIDDGTCTYTTVPANDLCADAVVLTCGTTVDGTTGLSTATDAPAVCSLAADNGVWYTFVGDGSFVTLSTCGSAIDTRLEVVTADACGGPYTCVIDNDNNTDVCGFFDGDDASVSFVADNGVNYFVYVTSGGVDTNGDGVADLLEGPFSLTMDCTPVVAGCMDACACNYDPTANVDNLACDFFGCVACTDGSAYQLQMVDSFGDGWNGNTYTITDALGNVVATGNLDAAACVHDTDNFTGANDGFDMICLADACYSITIGGGNFSGECSWTLVDVNGATMASGTGAATTPFTIGGAVCGCTDPGACNYDVAATSDDGSCDYTTCSGCTDPTSCTYDAAAIISDPAACCYDNCVTFIMNDSFGDGWNGNTASIVDLMTGTVVATAGLPAGATATAKFCLPDGCYTVQVGGGTFPGEVSWIMTGTNGGVITGGVSATATQFSVGAGVDCTPACTEPVACNYNPNAMISDCSLCEYTSCLGCTYPTADNYDANAGIDDGTCTFPAGTGSSACGGTDFNNDGIVNVSDLNWFLSWYGCTH
jgi:hypothetical protein